MSRYQVQASNARDLLRRCPQVQCAVERRISHVVVVLVIREIELDGIWAHRAFMAVQIESHVVAPVSIVVSGRRRRAKTNRIDGAVLFIFAVPVVFLTFPQKLGVLLAQPDHLVLQPHAGQAGQAAAGLCVGSAGSAAASPGFSAEAGSCASSPSASVAVGSTSSAGGAAGFDALSLPLPMLDVSCS